ncbi:MAG: GNAT family N-acetyltransferase [Eubacteriales bacterium]|nr:GNAT family N-acetyltransferase [Eubacteriales bacterium]
MKIIRTDCLSTKQKRDVTRLTASCNEADKTCYGTPDDADDYCLLYEDKVLTAMLAVYYMGDTYKGRGIAELSAFTLPEKRREGRFGRLMDEVMGELAKESARNLPGQSGTDCEQEPERLIVRFAVYENADVAKALCAIGAVHDHDELMLELELKPGTELQPDVTIDHEAGKAESKYSECYFRTFEEKAYVFGVMTYANYLRKGHAGKLLKALFKELSAAGIRRVLLQVSSENEPALKLYEKLGFSETERLKYFYFLDTE